MMHPSLMQYMLLVDFLGSILGPDYEVVLHDFSEESSAVIAISNSHISGRSIDAPLNKHSLEAISKQLYKEKNYISDYTTLSASGKMLRSCTHFIKDDSGSLIGLLCINFDDSRYHRLVKNVFALCHPDDFIEQKYTYSAELYQETPIHVDAENFHASAHDAIDDVLIKVISDRGIPVERLTQEEKMEFVSTLDENGMFYIKGAVKHVSEALRCSQASIYRYIKKLRKNKGHD